MWQGPERRRTERRNGERRVQARDAQDRRQGDRRRMAGAAGFVLVAAGFAAVPDADAQVYTRRNERGVIEATNVPDAGDFRLTYPGKGTLIHSRAWKLRPSSNGAFDRHITAAAALHGVDVALVRAIIQVESDFDHLAISSKGAQGLMQLMPETAASVGVDNPFEPAQNVRGGTTYLRSMIDRYGDLGRAIAAYNAGPTAVDKYGGIPPYRETRAYVDRVLTYYRRYHGDFPR